MTLQVLIPCLDKTKDQLSDLCRFLNIQSDALFLNQTGEEGGYEFVYNGCHVTVTETAWRGVSRARNELIKRCTADIGLFIDDDCVLADGYPRYVLDAYKSIPEADAIRFNTKREYWNPVNAHSDKRRKAKFRDLSSFGMWGLSFRPTVFREKGVFFNEMLGAPNYLYNGEDSTFLFDLCKKCSCVYLDPFFVCDVKETKESTWFNAYGKRYFVTKGFVYSYLYQSLWWLALLRMYAHYGKEYKMTYGQVRRYAKMGHKMYKSQTYEEPIGE